MKVEPDSLAQFIRQVDGNNTLGAGALAEKICQWLEPSVVTAPVVSGWQLESIEAKVSDLDPDAEFCVSNADVRELVNAVRTPQLMRSTVSVRWPRLPRLPSRTLIIT